MEQIRNGNLKAIGCAKYRKECPEFPYSFAQSGSYYAHKYKIYINEALTKPRAQLYYEVRKLVNNRELDSAWTYDGKIIVKTHKNRKITIETEEDFRKLQSFIESPNVRSSQELDDFAPLTSTPAANRV